MHEFRERDVNPGRSPKDRMQASSATCRDIATAYARHTPPTFALDLRLGETRVHVRSNAAALIDALIDHYRDFLDDAGSPDIVVTALDGSPPSFALPFALPDGGDAAAKEDVLDLPDGRVVRKRRTGIWLVFGPGGHYVLGPCRDNVDQVINAVNARCEDREMRAGALLLHAAGVCLGRTGLAIAGLAGAGKSTLALHVMGQDGQGAAFVSNDRLLVGPGPSGLVMTGLARMPRVNPGTILHNAALAPLLSAADRAAYARLDPEDLWRVERKYDVRIRDCFGPDRFRLRAGLKALVVLCWRRGGGETRAAWTTLRARADLLPALMKDVGVFLEAGPRRAVATDYLSLLDACPVLVLEGGVDFLRAAALCRELLAPPQGAGTSAAPACCDA